MGYVTTRSGDQQVHLQTQIIPGEVGVAFGVRIIPNSPGVMDPVIITHTHPPSTDLPGTTNTWPSFLVANEPSSNFFEFEFPFELTYGLWTMEARFDGTLLYRVEFNVVRPEQLPDFQSPCLPPNMIS